MSFISLRHVLILSSSNMRFKLPNGFLIPLTVFLISRIYIWFFFKTAYHFHDTLVFYYIYVVTLKYILAKETSKVTYPTFFLWGYRSMILVPPCVYVPDLN